MLAHVYMHSHTHTHKQHIQGYCKWWTVMWCHLQAVFHSRNNFIQSQHPPSYPSPASCHTDAITTATGTFLPWNILKMVSQKHFTTIYLHLSLFQNVPTEVRNAWSYMSTSYICLYAMERVNFTFYWYIAHGTRKECRQGVWCLSVCKLLRKPIQRFSLNLKCMLGHSQFVFFIQHLIQQLCSLTKNNCHYTICLQHVSAWAWQSEKSSTKEYGNGRYIYI
jgi:hypothetical protein